MLPLKLKSLNVHICKFGKKMQKCINCRKPFNCISITYLLVTFNFSLWFLINILWNGRGFYANKPICQQCHAHWARDLLTLFSLDLTCVHWTTWPQYDLPQDNAASSSSELFSHGCITLMKRSSAFWKFGLALTTALLRVHLTSGWIMNYHAGKQIMYMCATDVIVLLGTVN